MTKPHLLFLSHLPQGKIVVWDAFAEVFHHLTTSQWAQSWFYSMWEELPPFICTFMFIDLSTNTYYCYVLGTELETEP